MNAKPPNLDLLTAPNGSLQMETRLYRVFPLWFFEECFRLKRLTLVQPRKWDDPYEDLCSSMMLVDQREPAKQLSLAEHLDPAFAQCWSSNADSDVLLRAYSRVTIDPHFGRNTDLRNEGVQVESSPRKLLMALGHWASDKKDAYACVGEVVYAGQSEVAQRVVNFVNEFGAARIGKNSLRAKMLLLKRLNFQHEAEVRMVIVRSIEGTSDILHVPIEPNEIFLSVRFDPRLTLFEQREREQFIRDRGYEGPIRTDGWYQRSLFNVVLPNGWEGKATKDDS